MIDEKKLIEEIESGNLTFDVNLPESHTETALKVAKATCKTICDAINSQPKVGEWIPYEKELPKKTAFYEVTTYCQSLGEYITDIADFVYTGFPEDKGGSGHFNCDDVIAWRPLPEPYQPTTED